MNPAPGWYVDPQDATQERYWNGTTWNQHPRPATRGTPTWTADFEPDEPRHPAQRKADAAADEERSVIERAVAARERGDGFFQFEADIQEVGAREARSSFGSSSNVVRSKQPKTDLLGRIEDAGWRLENVGYVFVETGATTSNRFIGTGQGVVTRGQVVGIYLFRADQQDEAR